MYTFFGDPMGVDGWLTCIVICSPRFPTPRRALFTTNTIMNSFDGRGKTEMNNCGWNMWN